MIQQRRPSRASGKSRDHSVAFHQHAPSNQRISANSGPRHPPPNDHSAERGNPGIYLFLFACWLIVFSGCYEQIK